MSRYSLHLQNLQVKFVCQVHRVKVKVIGVKACLCLSVRVWFAIERQSCVAGQSSTAGGGDELVIRGSGFGESALNCALLMSKLLHHLLVLRPIYTISSNAIGL